MSEKKKTEQEQSARPGGKKGLILGALMAVVLGAAGFYGSYSGLIPLPARGKPAQASQDVTPAPPEIAGTLKGTAFVDLKPMVISLGERAGNNYLRLHVTLEVSAAGQTLVKMLTPRIMDVLNEYLRAVTPADIEDPAMMGRLRAQMLRRVQVVTGSDAVRDLLIIEFVLS